MNSSQGGLISLAYKIRAEILLWAVEYEIIEKEMCYLKYRVNHWSGGRNEQGMSIMSLSIKGGRKENKSQDDKFFKNLFKHNTWRSISVLVRIDAKLS